MRVSLDPQETRFLRRLLRAEPPHLRPLYAEFEAELRDQETPYRVCLDADTQHLLRTAVFEAGLHAKSVRPLRLAFVLYAKLGNTLNPR